MNNQKHSEKGMTLIVKTVAGWVMGFIFVFGIYTVLTGHHAPGGGFSGGVILASGFILIMLAFGRRVCLDLLHLKPAKTLAGTGILIFLLIGLIAVPAGGYFLVNFLFRDQVAVAVDLLSAGTVQPIDIGIGLLVTFGIFLIFIFLSLHRVVTRGDKLEIESTESVDEV